MQSRLLCVALAVCLLVSSVSASTFCLGQAPSYGAGANCGNGAAGCKLGYYCDNTATCQPLLAAGGTCLYDTDCLNGYCQGVTGSMKCVSYVGAGSTCQTNATQSGAQCYAGFGTSHLSPIFCDTLNTNTCQGASYGDSCKNNADCISANCTSGHCGVVAWVNGCNSSYPCDPQSYCDQTVTPALCSPRKTSGSCNGPTDCAFGYYCTGLFLNDNSQQCIAKESIAAGDYCDLNEVCQSGRCDSGYCASGKKQFCTANPSNFDCAYYEKCTCNGLQFAGGSVGVCGTDPCYNQNFALAQCIDKNCKASNGYNAGAYPASPFACAQIACSSEYNSFWSCNGASPLAVSLVFTTLLAVFATYFSKEF